MPYVILKPDPNEPLNEISSLLTRGFPVTSTGPTVCLTPDSIVELARDTQALRVQLGLSLCSLEDYMEISRLSTCFELDVAGLSSEQYIALYNLYAKKVWHEQNEWFNKLANPLSLIR